LGQVFQSFVPGIGHFWRGRSVSGYEIDFGVDEHPLREGARNQKVEAPAIPTPGETRAASLTRRTLPLEPLGHLQTSVSVEALPPNPITPTTNSRNPEPSQPEPQRENANKRGRCPSEQNRNRV